MSTLSTKRLTTELLKDATKQEKSAPAKKKQKFPEDTSILRESEIMTKVFEINMPGVKITHCNFGQDILEVLYVMNDVEKDQEIVEKDLQELIDSFTCNWYKVKLERKTKNPVFKYTSPGQKTTIKRLDSSIGAYVNITGKQELHALVAGHDKNVGDILYSAIPPEERIGEVKVAANDNDEMAINGRKIKQSFDIGLVCLDQINTNTVTVNGEEVCLAPMRASIPQHELRNNPDVMLFTDGHRQGKIHAWNYNSKDEDKYGMIGIVSLHMQGNSRQAVHEETESGILVTSFPPYIEDGRKKVQAIGMLSGIEAWEDGSSVSLAVPISNNVQMLQNDSSYCQNETIEFA